MALETILTGYDDRPNAMVTDMKVVTNHKKNHNTKTKNG